MAGCFPEKPRWCLIEQVCQGSKVLSVLNGPEDRILRYIRLAFTFFTIKFNRIVLYPRMYMHWTAISGFKVASVIQQGQLDKLVFVYVIPIGYVLYMALTINTTHPELH